MLKFYTDVMGIGAGVVGMLMMAARFFRCIHGHYNGTDCGSE